MLGNCSALLSSASLPTPGVLLAESWEGCSCSLALGVASPESQAAQFPEKRLERGTVTTSAGDNAPVCVPGQAPGTMEQQSSMGNNYPIEG